MAIRVNPKLIDELARYGAEDVGKCYHCGNCSAVCNHAEEPHLFPRRPMRLLQMGLEQRLKAAVEPWLCYYCGQCSEQCPRGAEPGETMMSLRRWLTSRYDVTGLSRLFYRSWKAEITAIALLAVMTGAGLVSYGVAHGDAAVYDGPRAFLPSSVVHVFDWTMAAVLALLLSMNAARMWWLCVGGNQRVRASFASYVKNLYVVPLHFVTQKRYARCESKRPWVVHLALMTSYVTMLVLIMFFLRDMQAGPAIDWMVHGFGYAASAGLVTTGIWFLRKRLTHADIAYRKSHESDWIFLSMLLLVTVSGVIQHVLHRAGSDFSANIAYVAHLMLVVPMLVIEVPFSKWSHMVYRPLGMYFAAVQRDAFARDALQAPGPMRQAA